MSVPFSSKQIKDLNSGNADGVWIEAAIVTRNNSANPQVKDYFAAFGREFSYQGNLYKPLAMERGDFSISASMKLMRVDVTIFNFRDEVKDYVHRSTGFVVKQNDVVLQTLFMDNAGLVRADYEIRTNLQLISADAQKATFHCAQNYGIDDRTPKERITRQEFPMIRGDAIPQGI